LLKSWTGLDWENKETKKKKRNEKRRGGFSLVVCPAVVPLYVETWPGWKGGVRVDDIEVR
jgi:hypothetical protein